MNTQAINNITEELVDHELFNNMEKKAAVFAYLATEQAIIDVRNKMDLNGSWREKTDAEWAMIAYFAKSFRKNEIEFMEAVFGDYDEMDVTVWRCDNNEFVLGLTQDSDLTANYLDTVQYFIQPIWDEVMWQGKMKDLPTFYREVAYAPIAIYLGEDEDRDDVWFTCECFLDKTNHYWAHLHTENVIRCNGEPFQKKSFVEDAEEDEENAYTISDLVFEGPQHILDTMK